MGEVGTVYLLHFDKPFSHAQHYLGWGKGNAVKRLTSLAKALL